MDEQTARDHLALGEWEISQKQPAWQRRQDYYEGTQDLPFAPEGVNAEYEALREQSVANWLGLAMDTPTQRLRVEGFRTGRRGDADDTAWSQVWQPNKLDARQRIVYQQMMVHGRGLVSVWPNNTPTPQIRPENGRRVHVQMKPEDPFTPEWVVKTYTITSRPESSLWVPQGAASAPTTSVAVVYDETGWMRFERPGNSPGTVPSGSWTVKDGGNLTFVPFVPFDLNQDADGIPHSALSPLMPAQDAINTIRFNTLLAMQFSAFRQRVFTGYDPVVRDEAGKVVWQKNTDDTVKLDANGQPQPLLAQQGRIGVDRALAFPGKDTKVFDLPESNLDNYIKVLGEFLTQFFAVAQIPPQYLLSRMANLSGDALAGAESTLASLVADLQTSVGEGWEQVMRLANAASGEDSTDVASEVIWADAEARSFAQAIDAITKLIAAGFPQEAAFELIPGATPQKVARWMDMRDAEATDPLLQAALTQAAGNSPPTGPVANGAGNSQ